MSLSNTDTMVKILKCCFHVVSFMCQDPVYKVFVGCLVSHLSIFLNLVLVRQSVEYVLILFTYMYSKTPTT